ncbi:MAG: CCA tRNA nucleotidyltransferase [Nodosilinea sp.]
MSSTPTSLTTAATADLQPALSPQSWPFSLTFLPPQAYLVGGSVRDALLHRQADYLDLDFVLPEKAIETAEHIAQAYGAGFVVLNSDHEIARVVFPNATVDFAQQLGSNITIDLQRRDFTINAIAYSPHSETLVDPLNGWADLQRHTLCMVSEENLREDPLRLLRAYRQAAQLGFKLDPATQAAIRRLAPHLKAVAAERVRSELDCLLSLPEGSPLLAMAWQDGLLETWLPTVTPANLEKLAILDQLAAQVDQCRPDYGSLLRSWVKEPTAPGLHRSWLKLTKLSQLLDGPLAIAETTLAGLKYSRLEQQGVLAMVKGWHYLREQTPPLSPAQRYGLFKLAGAGFVGIPLLAWAANLPETMIEILLSHYLNPEDTIAHPQTLISGRDLIQDLGLKPGPEIGHLLEAVQLAQVEGQLTNRAEALAWIQGQTAH